MPVVLWQDPTEVGLERCQLAERPGGHVLAGTALRVVGGIPLELRYTVEVDGAWRTRRVAVERASPDGDGRIGLETDGDCRWSVDGTRRVDLDGCFDVDLEFTPATNLLPIRRLRLPFGSAAPVDVAWVRFPRFRVERSSQRYQRVAELGYEFRTGGFVAHLTVDENGLVTRYGDAWRQVAAAPPPRRC